MASHFVSLNCDQEGNRLFRFCHRHAIERQRRPCRNRSGLLTTDRRRARLPFSFRHKLF